MGNEIVDIDSAIDYIAKYKCVGISGLVAVVQFAKTEEGRAIAKVHHGLGRELRNELKLWQDGELATYFNKLGIDHPDDMSGILLTCFHRKLNRKERGLDGQIEIYQKYWQEQKGGE